MKTIFKNRLFLSSLCIFLAALLAFFVAPQINKQQQTETIVYVLTASVAQGNCITESDIVAKSVPALYLPNDTVTDKNDIVGQYAAFDLAPSDYVTAHSLSSTATDNGDPFYTLGKEQIVLSVTIKSFASGLSAKLQPDDIISFIAASTTEETIIPDALTYVQVLSTTTASGTDYDATAESEQNLPASITVLVTPEQAALLADLELNSNLHVALVCRGDSEQATTLLAEQQTILNAQLATSENISAVPIDTEDATHE